MRLLFALALLLAGPAAAQRPHVRLAVGGGSLAVGDYAGLFRQGVSGYTFAGVPVQAQREFPRALTAEAALTTRVAGAFEAGLLVQAQRSAADALYADYAGTFDLRSRFYAVTAEPQVGVRVPAGSGATVGLAVHGGLAFVRTRLSEDASIAYGPYAAERHYAVTTTGRGAAVGVSLSAEVPVSVARVALRAGYRASRVDRVRMRERPLGEEPAEAVRADLRHDLSGFTLTAGLAF